VTRHSACPRQQRGTQPVVYSALSHVSCLSIGPWHASTCPCGGRSPAAHCAIRIDDVWWPLSRLIFKLLWRFAFSGYCWSCCCCASNCRGVAEIRTTRATALPTEKENIRFLRSNNFHYNTKYFTCLKGFSEGFLENGYTGNHLIIILIRTFISSAN